MNIRQLRKKTKCINWDGCIQKHGYGIIHVREGYRKMAHRAVWEGIHGKIPKGLFIDHMCRNKKCVNIHHLRLVTLVENIMCGNAQPAINARKKKCVNGHLFTPNNIYPHKRGHRICKKCKIIKLREYYERNKHKHRHRYDQFDKRGDVNHIFGRHYCKCGKVKP